MIYSLPLLQDKGDKAKNQEAGIRLQLSCTRLKILSVKKKRKKDLIQSGKLYIIHIVLCV
jgi:hypothetical protein